MQAEVFAERTGNSRREGPSYAPMGNLYGIKGSNDLGDGLKSIYQIQLKSRSARPCEHQGGNMFGGIAGGWGSLLIGPHDQPVNLSSARTHLMARTMMDSCDLLGASGESSTGIIFISPSFSGLSLAQLIPLSNDIVTNDVGVIYSDGPFLISLGDQEISLPGESKRYRTDLSMNLLDWNGFTFGLYQSWLRRGDSEHAAGLFAWPRGQAPARESWRLQYRYAFGNSLISVQTGVVTEGDDGRRSRFSSVAFGYQFSKRREVFSGQMRSVTEAPGRAPRERITTSHGILHNF
jgi:predicted porin